jgi:hypothetical protein
MKSAMFKRPHHQRIARVLAALDADLLRRHACWFGGGTCIALRQGEYRESVDIDFLISDPAGYRELRQQLTGNKGMAAITRDGAIPLVVLRDIRADQYGIRTLLQMDGESIKFEIVREARIELEMPGENDTLCGISTLTAGDLAASKLLANSDRYADEGVFCRDLIDLAMLALSLPALRQAMSKAEAAYGLAVRRDLARAIDQIENRPERLKRCMQAMSMEMEQAKLWQKIRKLKPLCAEED